MRNSNFCRGFTKNCLIFFSQLISKKKFKEKVLREVFVLPSNPLSTWKISFFFIKKSNGKSIINTDNNKDKEKTITILIRFLPIMLSEALLNTFSSTGLETSLPEEKIFNQKKIRIFIFF